MPYILKVFTTNGPEQANQYYELIKRVEKVNSNHLVKIVEKF